MKPGEMYWANLTTGRRPILVVSREDLNQGSYVVAILFTTARLALRSTLPNCVPFQAGEFGLPHDCVAQGETITFLDKHDLDVAAGQVGIVDDIRMREVIKALGHVLDADCEPN